VWFDDIVVHEGPADAPNIRHFDVAQGNRVFLDSQGHFWIRNRDKALIVVGGGLTLGFQEGGSSTAGVFASEPSLRVLKANVSGTAGGGVFHPRTNSSADYKLSLAVDGEKASLILSLKATETFTLSTFKTELFISAAPFGGKASAFVGGAMVPFQPGKHEGLTELVLGSGKNTLSLSFGSAVAVEAEQVGGGFVKVEAGYGESKVAGSGIQIACVVSRDSPGIKSYAQQRIEKATALLGSGDLVEATSLFNALKAEFPDDAFVQREVDRGLQSVEGRLGELKKELDSLAAQLAEVAKSGDTAKFEELLGKLVAHIEMIKVRAPGSKLEAEAVAALKKSEGLNESIAAKLMEGRATKLLDLANKAFTDNKAVLALAIIDTITRNYGGTEAARAAIQLKAKVSERVEQLRRAVDEWQAVRDSADKLAKRGDVAGARKQIEEFLKKFPDFVPAKEYMLTLQ
jgi:hypothetical protein